MGEKMKKILLTSIITAAIFGLVSSAGCNTSRELGDIDRSEVEVVFEDTVTVGDIKWELLEAENLGPNLESQYGTSFQAREGKLIYISFAVTNMGEEVRQIFDVKVVDDKGDYYSVCTEAYGYFTAPSVCTVQDVIPDIRQEFNASFDVPLASVDLLLEVTDLRVPADEKVYIDLGL
jgi:predicted small secreted protein